MLLSLSLENTFDTHRCIRHCRNSRFVCVREVSRLIRLIFGASLDVVAFAAPAALVAGAADDVVQEAFALDEFARKDVLFRNL